MKIIGSSMSVAQYCKELAEKTVIVNHDYQRSPKVWPTSAQSFLIESILLGYPVPKLALFQITNRTTLTTTKEIVDGQQRTEAIRLFAEDKLRLSTTLEFSDAAGRKYSELDPALQDSFLSYALGLDIFVDSVPQDIRETFRRVNAYETPLNGEEQRHAQFQGEFKWFIYHLSKNHDESFKLLGTFAERQLARMADMKLLTEITHALESGITTTNKASLTQIYRKFDTSFPNAVSHTRRFDEAILAMIDLQQIHGTAVTKPLSLYALLLALMHADSEVESLSSLAAGGNGLKTPEDRARSLSELSAVLDLDESDVPEGLKAFYKASDKGTNVGAARETRFLTYLDAVQLQS